MSCLLLIIIWTQLKFLWHYRCWIFYDFRWCCYLVPSHCSCRYVLRCYQAEKWIYRYIHSRLLFEVQQKNLHRELSTCGWSSPCTLKITQSEVFQGIQKFFELNASKTADGTLLKNTLNLAANSGGSSEIQAFSDVIGRYHIFDWLVNLRRCEVSNFE